MTAVHAEVQKNQNESTPSLVRRFSKRAQGARVISRARGFQFYQRPLSKQERKQQALRRIKKKKRVERLRKLGKIPG